MVSGKQDEIMATSQQNSIMLVCVRCGDTLKEGGERFWDQFLMCPCGCPAFNAVVPHLVDAAKDMVEAVFGGETL